MNLRQLVIIACAALMLSASAVHYTWNQKLPFGNGSFQEEWKPGTFPLGITPVVAFKNELWMIGQKQSWSSADGLTWTPHQKTNWTERITMPYAFFKNKIWTNGGLRYNDRVTLNEVWSSVDGMTWINNGNANWPARKGHALVVFNNKLWIAGGSSEVNNDFQTVKFANDIWSSDDGITWKEEVHNAPWTPAEGQTMVVMNNKLYRIGAQAQADVWESGDGVHWKQLSPDAEWNRRYDFGALAFDNKLWVFGGRDLNDDHNKAALNDVWFSADGISWTQQAEHAPWTVRSGGMSVVFKDQLWIYSGKHTGSKENWGGDVWTLSASR